MTGHVMYRLLRLVSWTGISIDMLVTHRTTCLQMILPVVLEGEGEHVYT